MKRFIAVVVAGTLLSLAGCKAVSTTTPPAPLATGAVNSTDQQINAALQAAHAVVVTAQADIASGKFIPNAAYKTSLNGLITGLNQADPIYQQYHANLVSNPATAVPAALTSAVAVITADIATLTTIK